MLTPARFQQLLGESRLQQLFNELGWDQRKLPKPVELPIGDERFTLTPLAEKRGVMVFLCSADADGIVPPRATQLRVERELAKLHLEHLLIFADAAKSVLTWLWVARVPGMPRAVRSHTWHRGTSGESLRQKLMQIVWSLEEEDAITLTGVIDGLRRAFDRDRVTNAFYKRFQAEHHTFAEFILGLKGAAQQDWYASLMLNRLMFVYFIQKKGFLDGDSDYLRNRLASVQSAAGKGKFLSFYRLFLRRLFHEGLGTAKGERRGELTALIGDVPYLNGGLFEVHEIEAANPMIDVPDEAFERLFEFFDAWDWHLDDRPLRSGNEINPDVLGYIFEQYINQKQMGAYYTKEDITEYISKSTVIPHLLDQAAMRCRVAFEGPASIWSLLKQEPERYIHPAVKHGVIDASGNVVPVGELPDFVQTAMGQVSARIFERRYNQADAITTSDKQLTLPAETWREYVERRGRCLSLRERLAQGAIACPLDLLSNNVDARQFVQDLVDTCTSTDLLRAVWQAIVGGGGHRERGIAVLDPTCGSGAFLFAALNVLEPLYEACLDRMEAFVEDARKLGRIGEQDFVAILGEVSRHPSRSYYIYKSIILNNLFGVDIMAEAVEICKLRLFLKLVSQVHSGQELEPLPDIDFNIRAGNTLVGYATVSHFDAANTLASDQSHRDAIKRSISELAGLFARFRAGQTSQDGAPNPEDKQLVRQRLSDLRLELDQYLAREFGVDPSRRKSFEAWRVSHQPFHWFAEFYDVMHDGGFDVVIGNPPYIPLKDVAEYEPRGYACAESGNIYPVVLERCLSLCRPGGRQGYIVPVSSISTDGYSSLQGLYRRRQVHVSCYDDRPSRLFDGLEHIRLVIFLLSDGEPGWFSTRYHKWNKQERDTLFQRLSYVQAREGIVQNSIPKLSCELENSILRKLAAVRMTLGARVQRTGPHAVNFSRKVGYFLQILDFQPRVVDGMGQLRPPSEFKTLYFASREQQRCALALLNSNLFYWFMTVFSDCRHLNRREIDALPFPESLYSDPALARRLAGHAASLMDNLRATAETRSMKFRHDRLEIECILPKRSKQQIDAVDNDIAQGFGFSEAEVDFIVNYDIKYRMGAPEADE